jgi:hypothetical protein
LTLQTIGTAPEDIELFLAGNEEPLVIENKIGTLGLTEPGSVFALETQRQQLSTSVLEKVVICFGDIALAIGESTQLYLPGIMPMLMWVGEYALQLDAGAGADGDEEVRPALLISVMSAYVGIMQALKQTASCLTPYALSMVKVVQGVADDQTFASSEVEVWDTATGLVGDIVSCYIQGKGVDEMSSAPVAEVLRVPSIGSMVQAGLTQDKDSETARWAYRLLQGLRSGGS